MSIPVGEAFIGSASSARLVLGGPGVLPRHAIVQGYPDGQVVIRRGDPAAEILVNGVPLGPEPTPLLHGDKVQIGGHELLFVDERRSGSTQYVQAVNPAALAAAAKSAGAKPREATAGTGGRVISLTDGREYVVSSSSMVFGRDAGCDVVISDKNVSRRHAEIMATPKGYVLIDSSTNGTFVNGERVQGQRLLARGDVIRIGNDEFRFYADRAPGAPAPAPSAAPGSGVAPARAPAAPPAASGPPRAAPARSAPPAARPPGGVLANLVIRSGMLKGQRLPIRVPVVNVGRAEYNDIVLPDASVSTIHAKLQRREGVWVLADLDSTNGSFVDAVRVQGEMPLAPGAFLRFGEVQALFEPTDDTVDAARGSSTKLMGAIRLPDQPPGGGGAAGAPPASGGR